MNKVVFQFWENSIEDVDVIPDGCSIHIDEIEYDRWVKSIYSGRDQNNVPEEYDRVIGSKLIAFVEDDLFKKVENFKTIRLSQNQLNNLLSMEEIVIKD
jgi:hypothetical protein